MGIPRSPKTVQDDEQDLVAVLAALRRLRDCCTKNQDPKRYDVLTKETEKAQKKLDAFIDMLWKEYPQYAAVKYP